MITGSPHVDQLLTTVRENTVEALLAAQARALDAGAEIEAEPIRRDTDTNVMRMGALDLPSRGDLLVTLDGRSLIQKVESRIVRSTENASMRNDAGFNVTIDPFQWDAAVLTFTTSAGVPNWVPLRLWFLEWFQSRQTRLSPELGSVLHSIDGPFEGRLGWEARVDFGSASIEVIHDLVDAVAQTGCSMLAIR